MPMFSEHVLFHVNGEIFHLPACLSACQPSLSHPLKLFLFVFTIKKIQNNKKKKKHFEILFTTDFNSQTGLHFSIFPKLFSQYFGQYMPKFKCFQQESHLRNDKIT